LRRVNQFKQEKEREIHELQDKLAHMENTHMREKDELHNKLTAGFKHKLVEKDEDYKRDIETQLGENDETCRREKEELEKKLSGDFKHKLMEKDEAYKHEKDELEKTLTEKDEAHGREIDTMVKHLICWHGLVRDLCKRILVAEGRHSRLSNRTFPPT
jgi:hypothetical protein